MNTPSHAVCLDVGGTSVKSGIVGSDGVLIASTLETTPVDSAASAENILSTFASSLDSGLAHARHGELPVTGIGISICGPFDYELGISKITGLDKYESIYNVNVREELSRRLEIDEMPMLFDVDSWSFARGEVWSGAGRDYHRVIVFTMGTGVGSAFAIGRKIVDTGPGVPWYGWISGQEYQGGMLNDYISRTYMIERYQELTGVKTDIKDMAIRADSGDEHARGVFAEIGETLGTFLCSHHLEEFGAECLVFGGQISNAFHLFRDSLSDALSKIDCLKEIVPAEDIDGSALKGVARYVFDNVSPDFEVKGS